MQGWIKLHRKIQEHWLYEEKRKFSRFEAWLDLLMMANHEDSRVILGNEIVCVKRGQRITSIRKLCEKWGWSNTKVTQFLKLLETDNMIEVETDTKKTVITIVNYDFYQGINGTKTTENRHENDAKQTQKHTNKNEKNVKNNTTRKQVYEDDSIYIMLAKYFVEQIKQNNPNFKEPNYQKWANDIRLMIERDNRTEEQIKYLMKWVQQDDFEMANVLSPSKLRKRFDQLVLKVKAQKQKNKAEHSIPTRTEIDFNEGEDWH